MKNMKNDSGRRLTPWLCLKRQVQAKDINNLAGEEGLLSLIQMLYVLRRL